LRFSGRSHLPAGDARIVSKPEQLLELGQGEAEFLRALDEPDSADRLRSVLSVARSAPWRLREQASPLVEAKGLNVHTGLAGHFPDAERSHGVILQNEDLHPIPWYRVKDWLFLKGDASPRLRRRASRHCLEAPGAPLARLGKCGQPGPIHLFRHA